MGNEDLMNTKEVAGWLSLKPATVARLASTGVLPAVKLSRRFRFRREDVQRWLDSRRIDAGTGRGGRP